MSTPYAEDLPYFQTSQTAPDTWLDKAEAEIKRAGGKITGRGNIQEMIGGTLLEVIYLTFALKDDVYRVAFPVLKTRGTDKTPAARKQAATMLYHDVKARCD